MDNADEAGAVAAAEYYLRLTIYAAATGDTTELEAMSGEKCESCQSYLATVTERIANGVRWLSMPAIQLSESQQWVVQEQPLQYQVEFEARLGSHEYYDSEGKRQIAEDEHVIFALRPTFEGSWVISAAKSVSPEEAAQASSPKQ